MAREQRRKEAALKSNSKSASPGGVVSDGTNSTPSLKQPASLSGSQNVAQPSSSVRPSPQEVVSNLGADNKKDDIEEIED